MEFVKSFFQSRWPKIVHEYSKVEPLSLNCLKEHLYRILIPSGKNEALSLLVMDVEAVCWTLFTKTQGIEASCMPVSGELLLRSSASSENIRFYSSNGLELSMARPGKLFKPFVDTALDIPGFWIGRYRDENYSNKIMVKHKPESAIFILHPENA